MLCVLEFGSRRMSFKRYFVVYKLLIVARVFLIMRMIDDTKIDNKWTKKMNSYTSTELYTCKV